MEDLNNEAVSGSEDTAVSAPLSIRDSLKAAMTPEPEAQADSRARDEAGRFAQKPVETAPKVDAQAVKPVEAPKVDAPKVDATPAPVTQAAKAPPGWSAEAKASFETLPPHVQAAVVKREQEIDNGFKVLQDYKGLEEFSPMVKQAGTTHAEVMRRAVQWEQQLASQPLPTIANVAQMIQQQTGISVDKILHPELIAHLRQQPPQRPQQPQQQPVSVDAAVEQALRKRDTEAQIQAFFADPANVHAEAVADDMVALIKAGRATSIKDAYENAIWMRPDIRDQLIKQQAPTPQVDPQAQQRAAAADQARRASKSITGSSAPGPSANQGGSQPTSIRESLRAGLAAARGHV